MGEGITIENELKSLVNILKLEDYKKRIDREETEVEKNKRLLIKNIVLEAKKKVTEPIEIIMSWMKPLDKYKGTLKYDEDRKLMDILDESDLYRAEIAEVFFGTDERIRASIQEGLWKNICETLDYKPRHTNDPIDYIELRWRGVLNYKKMKKILSEKGKIDEYYQLKTINKEIKKQRLEKLKYL